LPHRALKLETNAPPAKAAHPELHTADSGQRTADSGQRPVIAPGGRAARRAKVKDHQEGGRVVIVGLAAGEGEVERRKERETKIKGSDEEIDN
jgi:hypothetical protein